MISISKSLSALVDEVVYLRTHCVEGDYPTEFQTYDEAWNSLVQSLTYLHGKLGQERYQQLAEMAAQARAHFDEGYFGAASAQARESNVAQGGRINPGQPGYEEIKFGARLMQDIEQVLTGKSPFAYPDELYRWPRGPAA